MNRPPKKLPYAVANFEEIREEGYSLVDKTAYLRELENFRVPVFCGLGGSARRFGAARWSATTTSNARSGSRSCSAI